ncbi:aminoadipate-semialdehyde dehydrogenase isoform 2-T2 [Cochliomyia hominivorax]
MSKKCYNLQKLQIYKNKTFIYERKSLEKETIYSYNDIINEAKNCLEYFQTYKIENNVGIAIDIKEHSAANVIILLGILNHNCHFYCLDFEATKDVEKYLRLSGVQYIISPNKLYIENIVQQTNNEIKILKDLYYLYKLNTEHILQNVRLCYTIATSGSTGEPKMVHVPYTCIHPNIEALSDILKINEHDIILLGSPATFDPFLVELFVALKTGVAILITSQEIRLKPTKLIKIMFPEKSSLMKGVTIYQTTPSLFRLFGQENIKDVILNNKSSLRCLILGGEAFPSKLELKIWFPLDFSTLKKRIFNIYGITEVSCWSSIHELHIKNLSDVELIPLGKSLDELTYFRIVDEFERVLHAKNCKGELEISSSFRRCFIPQYDADIKILETNEIIYRKTGDFVERDELGNVYYIGRINNTIKRLGKRLCLDYLNKKLENCLYSENKFYKAHFLWHEELNKLILYLVNERNENIKDRSSIVNILKENLELYEQPDNIYYGNELPLNRHGKVDKKKILQMLLTTQSLRVSPVEIFQEFLINVLDLPINNYKKTKQDPSMKRLKYSTDISFTKAGGTSFQALSLATEIQQLMNTNDDQRRILEMLLDDKVTIEEIIKFLLLAEKKLPNHRSEQIYSEILNKSLGIKLLWRCDLKKCIDAAPVIYQEKYVCVGSHSHILITVNALTGEEISRLKLNDRIECSVNFVSPQLALVGCYDGFLYGFDFINGNISWKLNVNGMIKAKPIVVNNIIIVASYAKDYNVMAFDLKTLTLLWRLKLGSKGIFSSPVLISEDSILFCSLDGIYALVEAKTGFIKWLQKLESPIFSTASKLQLENKTFLVLAEVKGHNISNGGQYIFWYNFTSYGQRKSYSYNLWLS